MGERERILDHLDNDYTEPVRDPVWGHLWLSRPLMRVVEHEQFQKLGRIRQLGPTALVYPGATHTRLAHSLGVFHLSRRLITSLVRRSPRVDLSLEGVKAFLCAALLHDVGHFPYAHSLKDLRVEAHERLAARVILEDFAPAIRSSLRIEPDAVATIIDHTSTYHGVENVGFYWGILSGVLDPDKLDYLNRDAYFCGVPYGIQDVDFALEEVWPHPSGLSISRKGVTALENILFSKYLMYKTVYWHKTVRIATAMIKKAIALALRAGAIAREELYGLDDEEFFTRFSPGRFPAFHLISDVRRRLLHRQLARIPFRDELAEHRALERVEARLELEERIADAASAALGRRVAPEAVIVDVPERKTFEVDVPVADEDRGATVEAGQPLLWGEPGEPRSGRAVTIFGEHPLVDLPRGLRVISLSTARDEDLVRTLGSMDLGALLPGAPGAPGAQSP